MQEKKLPEGNHEHINLSPLEERTTYHIEGRSADYNFKCNTAKKEERQHANYSVECSYHTTSNTR